MYNRAVQSVSVYFRPNIDLHLALRPTLHLLQHPLQVTEDRLGQLEWH